jgi:uncharacterized protein (TIGR03435 family)
MAHVEASPMVNRACDRGSHAAHPAGRIVRAENHRWLPALILVLVGLADSHVFTHQQIAFEVASIRPNSGADGPATLVVPPKGMVVAMNYPLLWLVRYAYGLTSLSQIHGGPDWLRNDRFDIRAVRPDTTAEGQTPLMIQALLRDRFRLQVHWESREQPVYALTSARADDRLGPDLRPSSHDCAAVRSSPEPTPEPLDDDGRPICRQSNTVGAEFSMVMGGARISELALYLEVWAGLDRPVVDETALNGTFDIRLSFTHPRFNRNRGDVRDLRQALQEQLGLKLEPRNALRPMLVIDSIERPSPD